MKVMWEKTEIYHIVAIKDVNMQGTDVVESITTRFTGFIVRDYIRYAKICKIRTANTNATIGE